MGKKIRDDEKWVTVAVCGFFTIVFALCMAFSGALPTAGVGFFVALACVILMTIGCWFVVMKNMFDPNYDKFRGS